MEFVCFFYVASNVRSSSEQTITWKEAVIA
jgi:hypothetical protein